MYLVGLGQQVLEWRITASASKNKCVSGNKFPFSGNDSFIRYMDGKYLYTEKVEHSSHLFPKVRISWTGNKVELVELIYAWEKAGCFNNGKINIKELVAYIETVFNINLGNYYHTFLEIRNRKGNRAAFLNKLIIFLHQRMVSGSKENILVWNWNVCLGTAQTLPYLSSTRILQKFHQRYPSYFYQVLFISIFVRNKSLKYEFETHNKQ